MRARCSNCGAVLTPGFDVLGQCPKCQLELHSCKQCVHFDTGAQFECTQKIPERIAKKDARNECPFFEFRMTVEKDTSPVSYSWRSLPRGAHATAPTASSSVMPARPSKTSSKSRIPQFGAEFVLTFRHRHFLINSGQTLSARICSHCQSSRS